MEESHMLPGQSQPWKWEEQTAYYQSLYPETTGNLVRDRGESSIEIGHGQRCQSRTFSAVPSFDCLADGLYIFSSIDAQNTASYKDKESPSQSPTYNSWQDEVNPSFSRVLGGEAPIEPHGLVRQDEARPSLSNNSERPYSQLIYQALLSRPGHAMQLREIYQWFLEHTKKGQDGRKGWQNSIRYNLSMNEVTFT